MIPNNMWPKDVIHAYHLRSASTSGGKDWIGIISSNPLQGGKMWVINGKTKDVLSGGGQGRAVASTATETALKQAVQEKLAKGYIIVDEYEARCGWHSQPSSKAAQPPVVPQQPTQPAAPPEQPAKAKTPKAPVPKPSLKILEEVEGEESGPTMCW